MPATECGDFAGDTARGDTGTRCWGGCEWCVDVGGVGCHHEILRSSGRTRKATPATKCGGFAGDMARGDTGTDWHDTGAVVSGVLTLGGGGCHQNGRGGGFRRIDAMVRYCIDVMREFTCYF